MATHRDFFVALLRELNLPVRGAGLRAMACVNIYENPQGNLVWWNPLACSLKVAGSKPLYTNRPGSVAQIYPSFQAGVDATAEMYSGLRWTGVRDALNNFDRRGRILDAFTAVYTWPDPRVDFRELDYNRFAVLNTRLRHQLLGPS